MATSPVPMFDPNGDVRMVPPEQISAAQQSGGQPAIQMTDPQGTARWVRQSQQNDALAAGGKFSGPTNLPGQQWAGESPIEQVKGFVKGGMQTVGGIGNLISQEFLGGEPGQQPSLVSQLAPSTMPGAIATQALPEAIKGPVRHGIQLATNWLNTHAQATDPAQQRGKFGETMTEFMALPEASAEEAAARAGQSLSEFLSDSAKTAKAIEGNTKLARVVRAGLDALKGGAEAGTQTAAQSMAKTGGDVPASLEAGAEGAALGAGIDLPVQAAGEIKAARLARAESLAPEEMNVRGVPFTVLRSELPGATAAQTKAATIGETPALRQARQEAWQQLPVNLARDATANIVNSANDASVADLRQRLRDTNDPDLEQQLTQQINDIQAGGAGTPAWSYITPEGRALSPAQTRSAMNDLREHWMSQDFSPAADQAIQERYNDMQDQLSRYDSMQGTQPVGPIYHVGDAVNSTSSFADTANHARIVADRALSEMPQRFRNDYTNLADQRAKLQDQFDSNAGVPKLQAPIQKEINRINTRMDTVLQEPDVADAISQPRAEQALKNKRLSDAFSELHNIMTKHVTLTPAEAADLGTPSEARGTTQSLVDDIRSLRERYGDVLDPALGDRGLNHILDLGKYMDMPEGRERVQGLLGNMMMVLRRHFQGLRGMVGPAGTSVGMYTAGHLLGHALGLGTVGSLTALGAEAQAARTSYKLATDPVFNRMIRNRISIDPKFAGRFLYGAKYVLPRYAGPVLSSLLLHDQTTPPTPEVKNAPSQRNP